MLKKLSIIVLLMVNVVTLADGTVALPAGGTLSKRTDCDSHSILYQKNTAGVQEKAWTQENVFMYFTSTAPAVRHSSPYSHQKYRELEREYIQHGGN